VRIWNIKLCHPVWAMYENYHHYMRRWAW